MAGKLLEAAIGFTHSVMTHANLRPFGEDHDPGDAQPSSLNDSFTVGPIFFSAIGAGYERLQTMTVTNVSETAVTIDGRSLYPGESITVTPTPPCNYRLFQGEEINNPICGHCGGPHIESFCDSSKQMTGWNEEVFKRETILSLQGIDSRVAGLESALMAVVGIKTANASFDQKIAAIRRIAEFCGLDLADVTIKVGR